MSKEATGAGSGLAAMFSFKTRIEEKDEVEFDVDIDGCCKVSESKEEEKLSIYEKLPLEFPINLS